ncbi:hypothetical protein SAMN05216548_10774 [Faunimonas pinastri]|uniref:Uncharacterized protein n=2 Tax=Faunimonas pinastri TaxID=1855383 RepID=A0A1H9IDY2_9HYPH|nr:hypothetical protein SAMN05216548_10774 [Faunimonas pinastri]
MICGVIALSSILYIGSLGFTSDDYSFLSALAFAPDQSPLGMFRNFWGGIVSIRPIQILNLVLLYRLFGFHAFGYHLVNLAVLCATACMLLVVLRQLRVPRLPAVAISLLFLLLPHASTDRFWIAAFQIPLSLLFLLVSMHLDLRSVQVGRDAGRLRFWTGEIASIGALLCSGLAYEIALPLFLAGPAAMLAFNLFSGPPHRPWSTVSFGRDRLVIAACRVSTLRSVYVFARNFLIVGAIFAFKSAMNQRGGLSGGASALLGHLLANARQATASGGGEADFGLNVRRFLGTAYVDYGVALPLTAWRIWREFGDWRELALAVTIGAAVAVWLGFAARRQAPLRPSQMLLLVGLGLLVSALGCAVFLLAPDIQFTLAGIGNRVFMVSVIGTAAVLAGSGGLAGWIVTAAVTDRPGSRLAGLVFAALVGIFAGSGALMNTVIGSFWVDAAERQRAILADIRDDVPSLPRGAVLILDGPCRYSGPAPVFESPWDLASALQLTYGDPTIRADIASSRLSIGDDALGSSLYRTAYRYPYSPTLLVYDRTHGRLQALPDRDAAEGYFRGADRSPDRCPPAFEGVGVPVFAALLPFAMPLSGADAPVTALEVPPSGPGLPVSPPVAVAAALALADANGENDAPACSLRSLLLCEADAMNGPIMDLARARQLRSAALRDVRASMD